MPEGDTIHRVAGRLRPALVGQPLVRLDAPRAAARARRRPPPAGTVVTAVDAVGKHLLVRFADGSVLRTHLRMTGSWHLYATGERWRKPPHLARAVVEVPGWVAVCFAAPVVELEHDRTGTGTAHLGPDLARPDVGAGDVDACLARLRDLADPAAPVADVLLDQRIACGVGNVFKSEVLWACRVDPATPVGALDEALRRRLLETAAAQLGANAASSGPRRTHPQGLAVYGRRGRPCPRCATPVRAGRLGTHARTTYWCPTCQPASAVGAAS